MRKKRRLPPAVRRALLRAARTATEPVSEALGPAIGRLRGEPAPPPVALDDVRRRLELLVGALYGRPIPIDAVEPPPRGSLVRRVMELGGRAEDVATSDGASIRLPRAIAGAEPGEALARYRLLALEHAERVTRGTSVAATGARGDPLVRDLYLLRESALVDASLSRSVGSLAPALAAERAAALARRPSVESLGGAEREVERLVQKVLQADPAWAPLALAESGVSGQAATGDDSPLDSMRWAREMAERLRAEVGDAAGKYRGVPPVSLWGAITDAAIGVNESAADSGAPSRKAPGQLGRRGRVGSTLGRSASPDTTQQQRGEDPDGAPTGEDSPRGKARVAPDGTERGRPDIRTMPSAQPTSGTAATLDPIDDASRVVSESDPVPDVPGVVYPEWDERAGRYGERGATVRESRAAEGDARWGEDALAANAVLVRRVRQRFERLRSRRTRLFRQRDGQELDIAACVDALVERRRGHAPDDRLYVDVRPARRGVAIGLLVDVSGSTEETVSEGRRIIDVERTAVLLASEAFDALGDRYAVFAFSSNGAPDVRVSVVKDFDEGNGAHVRGRIAAMVPDGNTRAGAAIRHAAARLARQPAGHRLLLVLSDGKPRDRDGYVEEQAVEDTRRAVLEARAEGVFVFCLTVDREEPEAYLSHIFGEAGHTILRDPEQLPAALLVAVRQLIGVKS